jgi:hypothetical protein
LLATLILVGGIAQAADNCTGHDVLVSRSGETLDLGGGHSLTVFRSYSVVMSENSIYNMLTGECSGTALATPDGKVRSGGHCARKDKDGHTQSIEWSQPAGAEKGMWRSVGGTGKFAGKTDAGWFKGVVSDGAMNIGTWGGTCK